MRESGVGIVTWRDIEMEEGIKDSEASEFVAKPTERWRKG
jgi:hypothetical protein